MFKVHMSTLSDLISGIAGQRPPRSMSELLEQSLDNESYEQ